MMLGTGPSIQLVRLFGIRIGASPSWFVVLFIFIYFGAGSFQRTLEGSQTQAYVVAVIAVFLFFVSLVLHELGHALVARREGITISGIDLWFFGGVARMSRDTDSPGVEFRVSAAGPAVTFVIVAVLVAIGVAIAGPDRLWDIASFQDNSTQSAGVHATALVVPAGSAVAPSSQVSARRTASAIAEWVASGTGLTNPIELDAS